MFYSYFPKVFMGSKMKGGGGTNSVSSFEIEGDGKGRKISEPLLDMKMVLIGSKNEDGGIL
jgi:hypothetical protein